MRHFKNLFICFFVMAFMLPSCNSSENTTEAKITDIPATTKSEQALASFREGVDLADLGVRIKARAAFDKAIEQDPNFGIAYLMRANTATTAKEYADDITKGQSNLDSASTWEKLYAEYMATTISGERDKGVEAIKKIAASYPNAARAQVLLGSVYEGSNQFDKARECFTKAVEINPKWAGGYSALSNAYLFDKPFDLKKAEENALKLVEMAPKSSGAQITLGDCYRAQNDLEKAKTAYEKAVSLDPAAPEAYYKLGHANTYLGKLDDARKNYTDAGTHDNSKTAASMNIAYTYLYGDDAKSATKYIMDQMSASSGMNASEKSNCLNTIANIAMHNGDASALKTVVNMMDPVSKQINMDLGNSKETKILGVADSIHWQIWVAIAEGKYDVAKSNLEAMKTVLGPIQDNRKLETYEMDMGILSMKQKNYDDAITHFEKADPVPIYNKYMLAKANEAAGHKEKADALFKEVAAYNFNDIGNALVRNEIKKRQMTP